MRRRRKIKLHHSGYALWSGRIYGGKLGSDPVATRRLVVHAKRIIKKTGFLQNVVLEILDVFRFPNEDGTAGQGRLRCQSKKKHCKAHITASILNEQGVKEKPVLWLSLKCSILVSRKRVR